MLVEINSSPWKVKNNNNNNKSQVKLGPCWHLYYVFQQNLQFRSMKGELALDLKDLGQISGLSLSGHVDLDSFLTPCVHQAYHLVSGWSVLR